MTSPPLSALIAPSGSTEWGESGYSRIAMPTAKANSAGVCGMYQHNYNLGGEGGLPWGCEHCLEGENEADTHNHKP